MTAAEGAYSRIYSIVFVLLATGLWIFHRWQQQSRFFKIGNKMPGPVPLPFVGNALLAVGKKPEDLHKIALGYIAQYGNVVRAWVGSKLVVFLLDPNDAEVILNSQVNIDKSEEYKFFEPWLGKGLLTSSGEKWRSHRKMIAPTFHINILKSFIGVFNQNSRNVVNKMKKEIGKTFDVHDYMSGVTVDILLETAMGITRKTQTQAQSSSDYASAVMEMCDIVHRRQYKFWLRFDITFKLTKFYEKQKRLLGIIHGLTNKVIKLKKDKYLEYNVKNVTKTPERKEKKVIPETGAISEKTKTLADTVFSGYRDDLDFNDENDIGEKKRLPFLDLMIESVQNGTNKITDYEIKEQVDTIMFEGHDTTAAGSSFVFCLLGVHQDIQDKVYNEIYEIFGNSDRPVTFEDTLQMKYLERVIFETMRMYPPVPIIARKLKTDVKIVTKDYVIPAGATVVIGTYQIHRQPEYYRNPDVFDPDNFLPENTQNRPYYSYIPFSAGPRSCVGRKYALLKMKILITNILRNYKMVSNITEDQFKLQGDIILKRFDGFRVQIEPRNRVPSTVT